MHINDIQIIIRLGQVYHKYTYSTTYVKRELANLNNKLG